MYDSQVNMINFEQQYDVFVVGSVEARDEECDMRRGRRASETEMATLKSRRVCRLTKLTGNC